MFEKSGALVAAVYGTMTPVTAVAVAKVKPAGLLFAAAPAELIIAHGPTMPFVLPVVVVMVPALVMTTLLALPAARVMAPSVIVFVLDGFRIEEAPVLIVVEANASVLVPVRVYLRVPPPSARAVFALLMEPKADPPPMSSVPKPSF